MKLKQIQKLDERLRDAQYPVDLSGLEKSVGVYFELNIGAGGAEIRKQEYQIFLDFDELKSLQKLLNKLLD